MAWPPRSISRLNQNKTAFDEAPWRKMINKSLKNQLKFFFCQRLFTLGLGWPKWNNIHIIIFLTSQPFSMLWIFRIFNTLIQVTTFLWSERLTTIRQHCCLADNHSQARTKTRNKSIFDRFFFQSFNRKKSVIGHQV